MERTIWDKMIDSIDDHIHIEYVNADKSIIQGQNECAKACEHICLQVQIDLLEKQNEKLKAKKSYLHKEYNDYVGDHCSSNRAIVNQIKGVDIAIDLNEKEIQELSKQLDS